MLSQNYTSNSALQLFLFLDEKHNKASNPELSRREKLLKWREERKQKKGTEPQKKSFVVRHMKYENEALLFSNAMKKATKGAAPLIKPSQYAVNKPDKRVTRASARIAKQSTNVAADSKTGAVEKVEPKSKAASGGKLKEKVSYIYKGVYCLSYDRLVLVCYQRK